MLIVRELSLAGISLADTGIVEVYEESDGRWDASAHPDTEGVVSEEDGDESNDDGENGGEHDHPAGLDETFLSVGVIHFHEEKNVPVGTEDDWGSAHSVEDTIDHSHGWSTFHTEPFKGKLDVGEGVEHHEDTDDNDTNLDWEEPAALIFSFTWKLDTFLQFFVSSFWHLFFIFKIITQFQSLD